MPSGPICPVISLCDAVVFAASGRTLSRRPLEVPDFLGRPRTIVTNVAAKTHCILCTLIAPNPRNPKRSQ
eukprot:191-Amphidinium_carterae.1